MLHRPPPPVRLTAAVLLAIGALGGVGSAASQQRTPPAGTAKKIYCWEQGGRRICGDALPAEAANAARTEISTRSGLATRRVARAPNDAERAVAAQAAEDSRRQAELEAAQLRRDLAMVESYATEADLQRAYGERIGLLEAAVKTSRLGVANLRLSLLSLLRQASDRELAGQPVPQPLHKTILGQHDELLLQQRILADQLRDRAALDADLTDAVQRYQMLKQAAGPASPADGPAPAR